MGTMEIENIGSMTACAFSLQTQLQSLSTDGIAAWRASGTTIAPPTYSSGVEMIIDGWMGSIFTCYDSLSGAYAGI